MQSVGDFASSAAVGLLWTVVSPTVGFVYAAGWMVLSMLASLAALTSVQQDEREDSPEREDE